jgi:hypothetical protein
VNPEAEKKLFATFNVMLRMMLQFGRSLLSQAPLLLKLEQLNEKNANSYVRWSHVLVLIELLFIPKTKSLAHARQFFMLL